MLIYPIDTLERRAEAANLREQIASVFLSKKTAAEALSSYQPCDKETSLLARNCKHTVGAIVTQQQNGSELAITEIFVADEYQGQGIGRLLLDKSVLNAAMVLAVNKVSASIDCKLFNGSYGISPEIEKLFKDFVQYYVGPRYNYSLPIEHRILPAPKDII
ncbi:MAG: GNAT family N-acetyltransferase [Candidatus Woesearchaeota archaeon]